VPIVVAVAVLAALWWGFAPDHAAAVHAWLGRFLWPAHVPAGALAAAFITAAAVLIIACPCAMGLATPAAIMAGSNAAAQRGILIRDGVALEKAGQVTAVVFDKTGTLTQGKPEPVSAWEGGQEFVLGEKASRPATGIVQLAAALARHSTHPISRAVASLSAPGSDAQQEPDRWEEIHGAGVQGVVAGTREPVRLGALRWLAENGATSSAADAFIRKWSADGATLVGLSVGSELRGVFALKDTLKPGARDVVATLQGQGLKIYLLTGDNALTAASVAAQAGIPAGQVTAGVRPEHKAGFVQGLQEQGERVAFVGDGLNDAPALEQADLGVAVSRATDIAREAADIVLLRSDIEAVPESLGLARATLRTIKQNLFWAFFYNAAGIPLAALGFMSPILCAAAMGVSDLIVLGNALRLRRWKM
jgi:Cu+-exporting ATPase